MSVCIHVYSIGYMYVAIVYVAVVYVAMYVIVKAPDKWR